MSQETCFPLGVRIGFKFIGGIGSFTALLSQGLKGSLYVAANGLQQCVCVLRVYVCTGVYMEYVPMWKPTQIGVQNAPGPVDHQSMVTVQTGLNTYQVTHRIWLWGLRSLMAVVASLWREDRQ